MHTLLTRLRRGRVVAIVARSGPKRGQNLRHAVCLPRSRPLASSRRRLHLCRGDGMMHKLLISLSALVLVVVAFPVQAQTPSPPGTYYGYPAYAYPGYAYPPYGYPANVYPPYPPPGYGYSGYSDAPGYTGPPSYGYHGDAGYPAYPPNYEHQGNGAYPPYSGSPGHGEPRQWEDPALPPSPGYEYQTPPSLPPYSLPAYRASATF